MASEQNNMTLEEKPMSMEPLCKGAQQQLMKDCRLAFAPYRWRRFTLRLMDRKDWHLRSLLLWLCSRASLRFLPFPYPSVISPAQWIQQAELMCQRGLLPGAHLRMAKDKGGFTAHNLQALSTFRNRVGWQLAFLEDDMLTGMMAARSMKGQAQVLREAAFAEAKDVEHNAATVEERERAARSLFGPQGGLPTLKMDLVHLAGLCHVPVEASDTIATISAHHSRDRPEVCLRDCGIFQDGTSGCQEQGSTQHSIKFRKRVGGVSRIHEVNTVARSSSGSASRMDGHAVSHGRDDWGIRGEVSVSPSPSVAARDAVGQQCSFSSSSDQCGRGGRGNRLSFVDQQEIKLPEAKTIKTGLKQMISQAWDKHRRNQLAVSVSEKEV